jgi:tRNA-Thr(GGU) m(6)t(6)A37 methyltransferase TsaA
MTLSDQNFLHKYQNEPNSSWSYEVKAVGVIKSPYTDRFLTPKQATISRYEGGKLRGQIQIFDEYKDCIDQLDGFDYIWVITMMHLNSGFRKKIKPMPLHQDNIKNVPKEVGLFGSRAPHRPNPIALSALEVVKVDAQLGTIDILGLDLLDGTPVLDIKPYVPAFDSFPEARAGYSIIAISCILFFEFKCVNQILSI